MYNLTKEALASRFRGPAKELELELICSQLQALQPTLLDMARALRWTVVPAKYKAATPPKTEYDDDIFEAEHDALCTKLLKLVHDEYDGDAALTKQNVASALLLSLWEKYLAFRDEEKRDDAGASEPLTKKHKVSIRFLQLLVSGYPY
jgi:hypothetical protein